MKNLLTLPPLLTLRWASLLIWVLAACSSGNKETADQDSVVATHDTTVAETVKDGESIQEEVEEASEEMSDTSQLEITFDETAGLVYERNELFYTVSITTNQYEASSNVTWYFDKEITPIYFKETWSAEGNEGSTEYFITDGTVQCAYIEESGVIEKWCRTTGGIRTSSEDESENSTKETLPSDYGTNVNVELSRYLDIIKAILNEADQTQEDEDSYSFIIAKTTEIGGVEVNESTEITIPKKVYKEIMGK